MSRLSTTFSALIALACMSPSHVLADLDGGVFFSREDRIKLTLPRGWRPSDAPSYPGVLLYLLRSQPEGRIIVGAEAMRQDLVCAWPAAAQYDKPSDPVECKAADAPLVIRYACAIRRHMENNHNVGELRSGPKENQVAGLPSVWFELTDNRRFVRIAVAANERRAVTMVLTTNSAADRMTHSRPFDQVLRSLHEMSEVEAQSPATTAEGEPAREPEAAVTRLPLPLYDPNRPCPTKR